MLMQPIKVFIMAAVAAKVYKRLENKEVDALAKDAKQLAKDEKWLHQVQNEEESIFTRTNTETLKPPNKFKLKKMRTIRFKEHKMRAISQEILLYFSFAIVVSLLGYFAREMSAYDLTVNIEEMFTLKGRVEVKKKANKTIFSDVGGS